MEGLLGEVQRQQHLPQLALVRLRKADVVGAAVGGGLWGEREGDLTISKIDDRAGQAQEDCLGMNE